MHTNDIIAEWRVALRAFMWAVHNHAPVALIERAYPPNPHREAGYIEEKTKQLVSNPLSWFGRLDAANQTRLRIWGAQEYETEARQRVLASGGNGHVGT